MCLICPPLVLDILNFIVGTERAKNRVKQSGERELQKNDGAERAAGGRGTGSGGCRNRLERGAAFFAAHAPLTCSAYSSTGQSKSDGRPCQTCIRLVIHSKFSVPFHCIICHAVYIFSVVITLLKKHCTSMN